MVVRWAGSGWVAWMAAGALLLVACPPPAQEALPPQPPPQPPPPPPPPPSFPQRAREGDLSLNAGFAPQPFVVIGTAEGRLPASQFSAPCTMSIAGPPEYILALPQGVRQLAVTAQSSGPAALMIMGEAGAFMCSPPGSPTIASSFPPGRYAIWVGTMAGQTTPYRLGFAERPSLSPEEVGSSIAGAWDATSEPIRLAPGFAPDPLVVSGEVRGTVAASQLDASCVGWIAEQPSYVFELEADLPSLRLLARHNRDTALVVSNGRGDTWCADDVEERFPIIERAFPRGRYRVWIATKVEGGSASYSLAFTTLAEITARSLPRAP